MGVSPIHGFQDLKKVPEGVSGPYKNGKWICRLDWSTTLSLETTKPKVKSRTLCQDKTKRAEIPRDLQRLILQRRVNVFQNEGTLTTHGPWRPLHSQTNLVSRRTSRVLSPHKDLNLERTPLFKSAFYRDWTENLSYTKRTFRSFHEVDPLRTCLRQNSSSGVMRQTPVQLKTHATTKVVRKGTICLWPVCRLKYRPQT